MSREGHNIRSPAIDSRSIEFFSDRPLAPYDAARIPLPNRSPHLLFSQAVLEHLSQPEAVCREMGRLLRPGGFASHIVDLRDHINFEALEMLRYPEWLWHLMSSNSHGAVNRARQLHFRRFLSDAGLELLEMLPTAT